MTLENQVIINSSSEIKKNFNNLPLPAYDLIPSFKPYYIHSPLLSPYVLVYTGKGCPFNCAYCKVSKTRYSSRSARNILDEFQSYFMLN